MMTLRESREKRALVNSGVLVDPGLHNVETEEAEGTGSVPLGASSLGLEGIVEGIGVANRRGLPQHLPFKAFEYSQKYAYLTLNFFVQNPSFMF